MKIPYECKIEGVTGPDPMRAHYHLFLNTKPDGVKPESGLGHLVATNGRALVILPVEITAEDRSGIIAKDAIEIERGRATNGRCELDGDGELVRSDRELNIECDADVARVGPISVKRPELQYPNVNGILSEDKSAEVTLMTKVSLNAKYLLEIQEAMGAGAVTLEFLGVNKPIRVRPATAIWAAGGESRAILMPVRTE